jgi:hypothetical protein
MSEKLRQRRTGIDWLKHELTIIQNDDALIYKFYKPNTVTQGLTFINSCGVMVVTGDYGNWVFCREFHPSEEGYVSDHYWCEKLEIHSDQKAMEYDPDETQKWLEHELKEGYKDHGYDLKSEEAWKEYIETCLSYVADEFDYTHYAYRELPGFCNYECVFYCKRIKPWLNCVFDAFEEICRRLERRWA